MERIDEDGWVGLFDEKDGMLGGHGLEETCPRGFYGDLFPRGFLCSSANARDGKPNGGALLDRERAVCFGDGLRPLMGAIEGDGDVFVSPCSFFGRRRTSRLRYVHALVVDLDYVNADNCWAVLHYADGGLYPKPTWVVNSGTGLHLYFQFEEPQPVQANERDAWYRLKCALVRAWWNDGTSMRGDKPQYSGLVQAYRAPGSVTKLGTFRRATAWRYGPKWTLDGLLSFRSCRDGGRRGEVDEGPWNGIVEDPVSAFASVVRFDEARRRWPDWDPSAPKGDRSGRRFKYNPGLYSWWLDTIDAKASVGHRFYCLQALAAFAVKCGIPFEELREDALGLVPSFDRRKVMPYDDFTEKDAMDAISAYDARGIALMRRETIAERTGIDIEPKCRRRGMKQADYLARFRHMQKYDDPDGTWRYRGGRKKGAVGKSRRYDEKMAEYLSSHPLATESEVAEAVGCSKPTAVKWFKSNGVKPKSERVGEAVLRRRGEFPEETMQETADAVGCTRQTVSKWLRKSRGDA